MKRLILIRRRPCAAPCSPATAFAAEPPAMDETGRMNYALGYQLGRDLAGTQIKPTRC